MWWDMAPALQAEFEDWHAHEHFPERLGLPGFLRASRWKSTETAEGYFVLYELARYETLTSPAYRERLDNPTPWSVKMMPHHRGMVRSQTRVLESFGALLGGALRTIRLSPAPGREQALRSALGETLARLAREPAIAGCHLLQTATPAMAPTREQELRGGDAAADWILLAAGFDPDALQAAAAVPLAAQRLQELGARPGTQAACFRLRQAAVAADYRSKAPNA